MLRLHVGESGSSVDKQWRVTVNSAKEATVLLVTKDSGSLLVWPTAVLLILSLCLTFYFPQRGASGYASKKIVSRWQPCVSISLISAPIC